jgi:hypothetical protein
MTGLLALEGCLRELEVTVDRIEAECEQRRASAVAAFPATFAGMTEFLKGVRYFVFDSTNGDPRIRKTWCELSTLSTPDKVWEHLRQFYRNEAVAYRVCTKELEGGRREFINRLFDAAVRAEVELVLSVRRSEFLRVFRDLEFEEQTKIAKYYFDKFGHLFPADVRTESDAWHTIKFEDYLKRHHLFMRTWRDIERGASAP